MVWRTIAESLTTKTPFDVLPETNFTDYVKSNKPFVVRNNRVYSVVTPDEIGDEVEVQFLEGFLFLRSFDSLPNEYMKVLTLCQNNLTNIMKQDDENTYHQQLSFGIPYTRLRQNTFKLHNTFNPRFSNLSEPFFEGRMELYYSPIIFNMAKSYSSKEDVEIVFDKPVLYLGKRKDLPLTKFAFMRTNDAPLSPINSENRSFFIDTEVNLFYFGITPFKVKFTA